MAGPRKTTLRALMSGAALLALAACDEPLDLDLRDIGEGFDTSEAARAATAPRPAPDARGVISYPTYQVAVARRGDRIGDVADRVGLPADQLARYNGIPQDAILRRGEVIALPQRVSEPSAATGAIAAGPIGGQVDVAAIAGPAIDRAGETIAPATTVPQDRGPGGEPVRHQVVRGETAFSIARLYGISARALAEWNGLGPDLEVREGQYLLIPTVAASPAPATQPAAAPVETAAVAPAPVPPGTGSTAPEPPSASQPLPAEEATPEPVAAPESPALANERTAASDTARLRAPVSGRIIRDYQSGDYDGLAFSAAGGTPVTAAADGTVAVITQDTGQVPIVVVRHDGDLLTVYAGVEGVDVSKGDRVSRGQKIAEMPAGDGKFLHFEVREGMQSVDPGPYLN